METSYYDDGVSCTLSLSDDESKIWITLSKVGVIELSLSIPVNELKLAIRKLTAK